MKKIILSLFLLLGVLSFAAPSYVDVNRIKKDGYDIDVNDSDTLAFTQKGSDMNLIVTMYFTNDGNPQNLRAAFKSIFAPQFRLKYIDELAKNQKRKGCYINVFLISTQEFPNELLEELADTSLDEIESYLK